ncbi:1-phosphatidylinositol 4-kinase [Synchytrium endobioticum]|uniref:1-phosphatidylinositol 4-kinase n=1 Tax=Synchytrium endobioticum TaxID=286115 RepID=A0A507CIF9_9FUNG|nr:1-phosphatidylinositol 4-kinase [Synchytrium endobioticum]TPX39189.1 1-phosphatidylinositol 4-kinase [Synchytrium endobioticum]
MEATNGYGHSQPPDLAGNTTTVSRSTAADTSASTSKPSSAMSKVQPAKSPIRPPTSAVPTNSSPLAQQQRQPTQSSWLLRLFQSEFFDARLAVFYLHRYPENVGIQYYVCDQLKRMPFQDLLFLLPQLSHLLVHNPTNSSALEEFMLNQCEVSSHWGLMLLWYLQTYMYDHRHNTTSSQYRLVKRVFHRCQVIMFADTPHPTQQIDYDVTDSRIRENIPPAVVGLGTMMAAIAAPQLMQASRGMVIMQGRRWRSWGAINNANGASPHPNKNSKNGPNSPDDRDSPASSPTRLSSLSNAPEGPNAVMSKFSSVSSGYARRPASLDSAPISHLIARIPISSPSVQDLYHGTAFSFGRYAAKASGSQSSLGLPHGKASWSTSTLDLRHTATVNSAAATNTSGTLTPALSHHSHNSSLRSSLPMRASQHLDVSDEHRHLVGSHYYHVELQFIMTLTEIANRLLSVPREARQRTLIAELELLNHNLPAEICVPLWCTSEGLSGHHKVVRIPPADAVVLNSADRVPYMVLVEVIESEEVGSEQTPEMSPIWNPDGASPGHHYITKNPLWYSDEDDVSAVWGSSDSIYNAGTNESSEDLSHASDYGNGFAQRPRAPSAVSFPEQDVFAEKMRTAAVMLAQLYQQQQRELIALMGLGANPILPVPSSPTLQNGTIQLSSLSKSARPATPNSSTSHSSNTASSALGRTDRRKYQKLKAGFEMIRSKIVKEMMALEETRVRSARAVRAATAVATRPLETVAPVDDLSAAAVAAMSSNLDPAEVVKIEEACLTLDKDDPSAAVFREGWDEKRERVRAASPYGSNSRWKLMSVIVKSGADLRQEQLALQLIAEMQAIWNSAGIDLWVCSYRVLVTSEQSGLVETVRNSISIHSIKKNAYAKKKNQAGFVYTLYDHFIDRYGHPDTDMYQKAQDNFIKSLAGYSLATYFLQIKDRHNGNILLLSSGHIVHIDFGFMLSNSPGSVGFELAPFKLSQEYLDVLGGPTSPKFEEFRTLVKKGFMALRKAYDKIVPLVEMLERDSSLPCFTGSNTKPSSTYIPNTSEFLPNEMMSKDVANGILDASSANGGKTTEIPPAITSNAGNSSSISGSGASNTVKNPVSTALRERFQMQLSEPQAGEFVDRLVDSSANNVFTRLYDTFQYYSNGIL